MMEQRRGHHGGMIEFKRLSPRTFEGTTEPMEAEKWIIEMKKVFRVLECFEGEKVVYAAYMMAVVSKALLVEMGLNKAQADRDNNQKKRPRQGEQSSSFQAKKQGTKCVDTKALPKCSRCGRPHADKDCHWNTRACFSCGQRGHRIAMCPQRKERQKESLLSTESMNEVWWGGIGVSAALCRSSHMQNIYEIMLDSS
nr:hypothetical protein CFP56_31228 [Quercus suber]